MYIMSSWIESIRIISSTYVSSIGLTGTCGVKYQYNHHSDSIDSYTYNYIFK